MAPSTVARPNQAISAHARRAGRRANLFENRSPPNSLLSQPIAGERVMLMNGEAILENVRRYRAIASLHRQTAAFRPHQRWSLLDQAEHWEHLALVAAGGLFRGLRAPCSDLPLNGSNDGAAAPLRLSNRDR